MIDLIDLIDLIGRDRTFAGLVRAAARLHRSGCSGLCAAFPTIRSPQCGPLLSRLRAVIRAVSLAVDGSPIGRAPTCPLR